MNRSDLSSMDSYSLLCVVIHSSNNNDVENSPCSMTRSTLELLPTSSTEKDAPTRMADAKRARRSIVDFIMIDDDGGIMNRNMGKQGFSERSQPAELSQLRSRPMDALSFRRQTLSLATDSTRMLRFDRQPPWRHHHHHRVGGDADAGAGGFLAIVQQQLLIATLLLLPMTLVLPSANAYSILDVLKLTGTTSTATCPAECTLCSCLDITSSSTTSTSARGKLIDECTQTKSIEACRLNTLDECFLQLLFPTSGSSSTTTTGSSGGATKDNVDIAGLCAIQCPTTEGAARPGTAIQCRLCDIFTCCGTCPTSMADQCFPPPPATTGGGYTPTGWEPLVCDSPTDTGGGSGGKSSSSAKGWHGGSGGIVFGIGTTTVVGLLTILSYYCCFVILTNIVV
jgi:hypothetical protein